MHVCSDEIHHKAVRNQGSVIIIIYYIIIITYHTSALQMKDPSEYHIIICPKGGINIQKERMIELSKKVVELI